MSHQDDVLSRIGNGDADAVSALLEDHRLRLQSYIERQMGSALRRKVEPDDVYQEVAIYAMRAMPTANLSIDRVFGWLCQIAQQRIVDAHRKLVGAQKRAADREVSLADPADSRRAAIIDLLVVSMTTPTQAIARDQRHHQLQMALAQLPEEGREALRLRYVDNLPSKEIAVRLGKSDGAVRVLLTRSLRKLQELLGSEISL